MGASGSVGSVGSSGSVGSVTSGSVPTVGCASSSANTDAGSMESTMTSASRRETIRLFKMVFIFLLLYTHFAIAADNVSGEIGFS